MTREVKHLKEVVVARDPPVVHVFDIVEHGRRFYRTLAFSSDASLSLASTAPIGVRVDVDGNNVSNTMCPAVGPRRSRLQPVGTMLYLSDLLRYDV